MTPFIHFTIIQILQILSQRLLVMSLQSRKSFNMNCKMVNGYTRPLIAVDFTAYRSCHCKSIAKFQEFSQKNHQNPKLFFYKILPLGQIIK